MRPSRGHRPPGPVEITARELLAAEIARQDALHDKTDPPAIVRCWWLGANPDVRDPRTGIVVARIKDVQGGQIQPLPARVSRTAGCGG